MQLPFSMRAKSFMQNCAPLASILNFNASMMNAPPCSKHSCTKKKSTSNLFPLEFIAAMLLNEPFARSKIISLLDSAALTKTSLCIFGIAFCHKPSSVSMSSADRASIPNSQHGRNYSVISILIKHLSLHQESVPLPMKSPTNDHHGLPMDLMVGALAQRSSLVAATQFGSVTRGQFEFAMLSLGFQPKHRCPLRHPMIQSLLASKTFSRP